MTQHITQAVEVDGKPAQILAKELGDECRVASQHSFLGFPIEGRIWIELPDGEKYRVDRIVREGTSVTLSSTEAVTAKCQATDRPNARKTADATIEVHGNLEPFTQGMEVKEDSGVVDSGTIPVWHAPSPSLKEPGTVTIQDAPARMVSALNRDGATLEVSFGQRPWVRLTPTRTTTESDRIMVETEVRDWQGDDSLPSGSVILSYKVRTPI